MHLSTRSDAAGLAGGGRPGAGQQPRRASVSCPCGEQEPVKAKAKSVIQIFLWGGMSHNDTWIPKAGGGQ